MTVPAYGIMTCRFALRVAALYASGTAGKEP